MSFSEIDLGADALTGGDGLADGGSRLFVVRHLEGQITEVEPLRGRREGRIGATITSDALMFPTTAAWDGRRRLVVNSQFDRRGRHAGAAVRGRLGRAGGGRPVAGAVARGAVMPAGAGAVRS